MDIVWADFFQPAYWLAVVQIIWFDILLAGDNAVVIALACRTLPARQRVWGIVLGAAAAVVLRIIFTTIVAQVMTFPFLKFVGGILLFWIAVKLITPHDPEADGKVQAADSLWRAVRLIAIADIVMSLDNVIAIAGTADAAAARIGATVAADRMAEAVYYTKTSLIIFGLMVSIPLVVAGSALLLNLLNRFPVLIWAGAGLLGWIAGEIMIKDPAVVGWLGSEIVHRFEYVAAAAGVVLVLVGGFLMSRQRRRPAPDI